jgi:tetratricopeptide (TPR) repeat protein
LIRVLTLGLVLPVVHWTALPAGERPATAPELAAQAEAKMKARQWAKAVSLFERAVALNPVNGHYWDRLARARYDARDYRPSIRAYEKVIELGQGYPWAAAYNIACCHALLGEKEQALKWLEKSFAMGWRRLHEARADADLKSLHGDPRFRELVAMIDPGKMSRDEGWRYDLKLLVRELKRIHYHFSKRPAPEGFEVFTRKLHDDIPGLGDHQIEVGLMKLAAMAGDGHTSLSFPFQLRQRYKALPVQFYLFEEGLYITAAAPAHKDLAGTRVLRFGDHTVEQVLQAVDPLVSRDNAVWVKHLAPDLIRFPQILNGLGLVPDSDKLALTLLAGDGKERTVTLTATAGAPGDDWVNARAATPGPEPHYLKKRKANYWFDYLPDSKTVYFQYNAVQNHPGETLEKFCARLFAFIEKTEVNRLVIDLRFNDGGNNFLNKPLIHGLIRCDKVNRRGKLFVIVGRNTFSAAQCGATQIERHAEALFVGEPTGSAPNFVGETVGLILPYSKMRGSISDLYWQNSVAMDYRTWIAPELYTPPTFAAYRAKRDPALEAILAYRPPQPAASARAK